MQSPEEKIKKAKQLLAEARRELRARRREKDDATLCGCGHRQDEHGPSHSINYTGGLCLIPRCRCMNFCMPTARDIARRVKDRPREGKPPLPITESHVKRCGSNPGPTTEKPDFHPPGQAPRDDGIDPASGRDS